MNTSIIHMIWSSLYLRMRNSSVVKSSTMLGTGAIKKINSNERELINMQGRISKRIYCNSSRIPSRERMEVIKQGRKSLKWKPPPYNLCIIIGNLLDNAIEGTLQLQENERQIFFKFVLKKDNFFLMIENSCQENAVIRKGNCFLTTKKEKGHGMGILSVKRAVEECKGDLCIDVQKGRFQVSVILPKQTANTRGWNKWKK